MFHTRLHERSEENFPMRAVQNRCACPRLRVVPERAHSLLGLDVALVIRKDQEWTRNIRINVTGVF